jgi:hypothetical protein
MTRVFVRNKDGSIIDLLKNTERYTGYAGESATKVWNAIYSENCLTVTPFAQSKCIEERVFYNIISGF